jgi:hypothetical protein
LRKRETILYRFLPSITMTCFTTWKAALRYFYFHILKLTKFG